MVRGKEKVLLQPFYSKRLALKNRVVLSAVPTGFVEKGVPTDKNVQFYGDRARSVGLIIAGAINIPHETASNYEGMPEIGTPEQILAWKKITDEVHRQDSKIIAQLWHSGGYRQLCATEEIMTMTPSGIINGQIVGDPMTVQEIKSVIDAFLVSAINSKKAGFDGIEIHGAHSGLIHNFLSIDTNERTDDYGLSNRTLFAQKVIRLCRAAVGEDFPILFRLSNFQMYDLGARISETPEELEAILDPLVKAGIDIFDCSALDFREDAFGETEGNLAYWVKKLTDKPVIAVGSAGSEQHFVADIMSIIQKMKKGADFLNLSNMEGKARIYYKEELFKQLEEGAFDLVALGRLILLDAVWVEKLKM
ncbi:NADH:flavin oxidoreductase [Pseudolactococcus yaeyamensis]